MGHPSWALQPFPASESVLNDSDIQFRKENQ